ncbi:bifunctional protein farnesyltransferase/protein geranylgeranyltransferase [Saccharomycopsis crataegensis]|uniref:Protein farnesyltransferase/geranylgeranyltransferase type-1 subunit alpha n=1 Tax=Saccharomycopsis crataegensis TaxID=43959 RepID=A0AAV5QRL7_9ASCO|nr:bifunctional protein farnesyltransferase/protein geranylgeranyltransferase [Saccharomycopsis crataegensis]
MSDASKTMEDFSYDDVTPMPFNEPKGSLCRIAYSAEYTTVMGIIRAFLSVKEYSERALAATAAAIELNPAHYTVWSYRYDIIKNISESLESDTKRQQYIDEELEYNESVAINYPKNYQIWNYRELLIKLHPNPTPKKEFPLLEAIIIEDNKNYHTWAYRTWLVSYFNLFDEESEINFVNILLAKDIRNNSAWNFRFFLKFNNNNRKLTEEEIEKEISHVKNSISHAPQNSSSWNYLTGIYDRTGKDISELEEFCLEFGSIDDILIEDLRTNDGEDNSDDVEVIVKSVYAVELLSNIYAKEKKAKSLKALEILTEIDPIRENYWSYKRSLLA